MEIVIFGSGKIGTTLADRLCQEGHQVTLVDSNADALSAPGSMDIMTIHGDALNLSIQREAGVTSADLVIAVLPTDEQNLLSCLFARRLGAKNTVARVRNPEYEHDSRFLKEELGLGMILNPELSSAREIYRLLRTPSAIKIDAFSGGRVELHKMLVDAKSPLAGMSLISLGKLHPGVLVCVVERGEQDVHIPSGKFVLQAGDRISFVARPTIAQKFFRKVGVGSEPVRRVILVGGGKISFYLARLMRDFGASVTIIEKNIDTCYALSEKLPGVTIIHGNGSSDSLMRKEGIVHADAVATLTGADEENVMISLYARSVTKGKIVTKINRSAFLQISKNLDLGSIFHPRNIAADLIVRYARALKNSQGSNVETLYKIVNSKAEALEFRATASSAVCGKPLMELSLRSNLLIGAINRNNKILTPGGKDIIEPGDRVIVVTTVTGLNDLDDILDKRRGKA